MSTPANIVTCNACGARNRIPIEKTGTAANCGRCRGPLSTGASAGQTITLRCAKCRTKNRVPLSKLNVGANCGRCGVTLEHRDVMSGRAVMVSDGNFAQTVLHAPLPVLLYAWAPWCSVCSGTGPMVDQLAMETKGKVRVAKVNIDANPALAANYNILSVPSFFIFDAGQLKEHLPGALPKHELMIKLARYI